jgi:hypothetical protein
MKMGIVTDITFITSCRLPLTILFIYNNDGCFINHEKTMCRTYKIIVAIFVKLIVTKWPYVNCIVWIMWLIFSYMTSTIGLYVFFLVHFECMYKQMKFLGCIQVTNICKTNSCKFKHPHKWSSWRAFNWSIDVGSYHKLKQLDKLNASYVYNVDKILSQSNKFQHLSTFDAWQWIFRRYFLMKGSLTIWVPKKE